MGTVKVESIKNANSFFKIILSNGQSFLLLPDIVYGRSLKEGSIYEKNYLDMLTEENEELLCFNALLKIVGSRLHSTAEIRRKLSLKRFKSTVIEKTILKAVESGVTDDKVAAQCYRNELVAKGYGSLRVKESFRRKGFSKSIIESMISEEDKESSSEKESARNVFCKKLSFLQKDKNLQKQKVKEKIFRFMQGRGYSNDIIFSLIKELME